MNDTLKTIKSRRSYRSYQPKQIKDEELKTIMESAVYAPTAMFQQKWHFTVVQNKDMMKDITDTARENILNSGMDFMVQKAKDPNFNPMHNAPTLVIISGDDNGKFVEIDCAAAAQNIMLAAESLNIGSCVMTSSELWFNSEKGKSLFKALGIPDNYRHVCAITLGYKGDAELPDRTRKTDVYNYVK